MSARLIMKLEVASVEAVVPGVVCLRFVHPSRPELPAWTAGAHIDVRLHDGRTRQYSLCGDPSDRKGYEIAVKLEPEGRGGSRWLHEHLHAGSHVHVSAPRNHFPLAADAARHVLVAGGIGITPILAMVKALSQRRSEFIVHLCAKSQASVPMFDLLQDLSGDRLRCWFSDEGRRFIPTELLNDAKTGDHIYACGPARLVDAIRTASAAGHWPEERLHIEHFAPLIDDAYVPESFVAQLFSTGRMLEVPADQSLLQVLRDNGHDLAASCELGVCGVCECGYREGDVIHRDVVLPMTKRHERLMPCVSRARGRVVLDL